MASKSQGAEDDREDMLRRMRTQLQDIQQSLATRGLTRQYSASIDDTLESLLTQAAYLGDDGNLPDEVKQLVDQIERLQMASRARVPPQQLQQRMQQRTQATHPQAEEPHEQPMQIADSHETAAQSHKNGEAQTSRKRDVEGMEIASKASEDTSPMALGRSTSLGMARTPTTVYSWGRPDLGGLLKADLSAHAVGPIAISAHRQILQVSTNTFHTAAVTSTGEVYTSGSNEEGQASDVLPYDQTIAMPRLLESLLSHRITHVACGLYHTVCVTSAGLVISFGGNEAGQLGHSPEVKTRVGPRLVQSLQSKICTRVACGDLYTLFLTGEGEVYSCGIGDCTGQSHGRDVHIPERVVERGLVAMPVASICACPSHAFAVTATGAVYGWGSNSYGQLGISAEQFPASQLPSKIDFPDNAVVQSVAGGQVHSAWLAASGAVFVAGRNKYGQLGVRVPQTDTPLPLELPLPASAVACGSNFTLILLENSDVVFTGENNFGQSGLGLERSRFEEPTVVTTLQSLHPVYLAAGGEHCFAICAPHASVEDQNLMVRQFSVVASQAPMDVASLQFVIDEARRTQRLEPLLRVVQSLFSSVNLLNASFLAANKSSFDAEGLDRVMEELVSLGREVVQKLISSLTTALSTVENVADQLVHSDTLRALLVAWQCPCNADPSISAGLVTQLGTLLLLLPRQGRDELRRIVKESYSAPLFSRRLLQPLQTHLSHHLGIDRGKGTAVPLCALALGILYAINEEANFVPYQHFYNETVSALPMQALMNDIIGFLQHRDDTRRFYFTRYAFLLSAETKHALIQSGARIEQSMAQQHALAEALMTGVMYPYLVISVERQHLLQHALVALSRVSDSDLKKPLKVIFIGEEGVDEGGVRKEFFQLLVAQLFDINFGMFLPTEDGTQLWFNKDCTWSADEYRLIGTLLGLAIYNGILLDLHFPRVIYKKLLGHPLKLQDLADIDAPLEQGLQALLDYPGDDIEDVFMRTFEVTWDDFGVTRSHELKPGGKDIMVNQSNKHEYVELYVKWMLENSVKQQFDDFVHGFDRVMGNSPTIILRAEELELMVVGTSQLDMRELEAVTQYEGYTADHRCVRDFWEVVHEMDKDAQHKLLTFATGCARAPIGGLRHLPFRIQRMGPDSDSLPTAHTCFNTLLLPEYSSREKLRDRLLTAINECEGFGLK